MTSRDAPAPAMPDLKKLDSTFTPYFTLKKSNEEFDGHF